MPGQLGERVHFIMRVRMGTFRCSDGLGKKLCVPFASERAVDGTPMTDLRDVPRQKRPDNILTTSRNTNWLNTFSAHFSSHSHLPRIFFPIFSLRICSQTLDLNILMRPKPNLTPETHS